MINLHVPGIDYRKKAALVWPPSAAETHAKGGGCLASPARAASPTSPGLAHWMSIMAEHPHMSNPHAPHDVHYMWNGVEMDYFRSNMKTKMNVSDQSHGTPPMQKGHGGGGLDEGRPSSLESSQLHSMYGNHGTHARSSSSSSNSPPVSSAATSSPSMLVVPQPINAVAKQPINVSAAVASAAANGSGRKYQCKMCPQIFMHKSAMQHHAREVHRGELKPHQCQQCLKSFSSNHQLVQHIRIHTGEKPYKCSYCDRRFKQLSHVQQHTRLHTGERPYKCHMPECGRAFIQLSNLQQHLRNHDTQIERAKNRPFHCSICGKGFATETSLRTHTSKQHAALIGGQNSQSCPVCHKLFLGNEALLDHMRTTHKDPNASAPAYHCIGKRRAANHPCPVCGKTYVNEGSLRKHIASHPETTSVASPLRMWPCSVCQSVFTQESGLLAHMEHMRMDPKHQFAAQYVLSRAAAERRERETMLSAPPGSRESMLSAPPGSRESMLSAPPGARESMLSAPPGARESMMSAPPGSRPPPQLGGNPLGHQQQNQGNDRSGGQGMMMSPGGGHTQPNN